MRPPPVAPRPIFLDGVRSKECAICGGWFPANIAHFAIGWGKRSLSSHCHACDRSVREIALTPEQIKTMEVKTAWRQNNLEKMKEYRARWRKKNPAKMEAAGRKWRAANPEKQRATMRKRVLKRFGLTPDEYDALVAAQDGRCAICQRADSGAKNRRYFAVDHCHTTNKNRGLLCNSCNFLIGLCRDDPIIPQRAAEYLTHWRALHNAGP